MCGLVKLHGLAVVAHSHSRIHTGVCHGAGLGGSVDARDFNLVEHTSSGGHAHGVETSVVGSEGEDQRRYGGHVLQLKGCTVDFINVRRLCVGVVVKTEDSVCLGVVGHLVEDERSPVCRILYHLLCHILTGVDVHHADCLRHVDIVVECGLESVILVAHVCSSGEDRCRTGDVAIVANPLELSGIV